MEPSTLDDPALGRLGWNDRLRRYEGAVDLGGDRPVALALEPFSEIVPGQEPDRLDAPAALVGTCAAKVAWLRDHMGTLSSFAASQLLADHNDGDWCQGRRIDGAEFERRMTPTNVMVDQAGRVEVSYDDGDLFWGHVILVRVDTDGRPVHAEFFG